MAGIRLVIDVCADVPSEHYIWTTANELRVFGSMCVTVDGHGSDGDPIDIESCNGGTAQQWHLTTNAQLQGLRGKCIATQDSTGKAYTRLILAGCAVTSREQWDQQQNGGAIIPPVVASVEVTPSSASIAASATLQLSAVARDSSSAAVSGATIQWQSSNAAVATVSATGLVLGVAPGTADVSAAIGSVSGHATIVVAQSGTPDPTQECASPAAEWIWCDDFEQDRRAKYFEVDDANGSLTRVASVGRGGSTALVAHFAKGQVNAGNLKLAFGRTPSATFKPVDGGTANYRELYWRLWLRTGPGWTGGSGEKLSRAMILAGSNWSQAMVAHVWGGDSPNENYLQLDPVSGTDAAGNLRTTTYNDFANFRWLGRALTQTPLFDANHVGNWYCIEAHVRLNDAGQSNGVFELWVNGNLEASRTSLNWIGAYNAYGINAVFIENYWNSGSPATQERYIDNLVVSTKPIPCDGVTATTSPPPPPPPAPAPVARVSVSLGSTSLLVGSTTQASTTLRDSSGNVLLGRSVTWTSSAPAVASVSATGMVSALLAGSATITATSEGISGSASLTVTAPPPPPSGSSTCPNEPAGLATVTDQPWNAVPPNLNAVDAAGWGVDRNPENLTIVTDPTAPRSASNVIHGIFPAGGAGGTAPFRVERPFASQRYSTIFECVWLMHSPNFTDNGNIGTKVSFYRGSGQNHYWGFESASGKDQFYFLVELQGGGGDRTIRTSVTQGPGTAVFQALPTGMWRRYEVLVSANTPGTANGILKVWADGVLIINLSDVAWWGAGQTPSWIGIAWEPVYGGVLHPIPVTMFQAIDHWYVSGK
jgi:uncharacterized protein YjdB